MRLIIRPITALIAALMTGVIRIYQLSISPFLPNSCRYTPTCSVYATESIRRYGPFKGGWMAIRRISRCHPWGSSGYDPVP